MSNRAAFWTGAASGSLRQSKGVGPVSDVPDEARLERYCALMHDAYEDAAHKNGWDSQVGAIPWAEVPEANKATMRVAVGALLAEVAAERQRLHDLEARIEALAAPVSGTDDYYAGWVAAASEILALVSEASASSPVSDDTGGTEPDCPGPHTKACPYGPAGHWDHCKHPPQTEWEEWR